jgi:26S proteasome regulatory subunit N2
LIVDEFWAEIADSVPLIESLSEDEDFKSKDLAAIVASKCFFHLEEYSDALRLALAAGTYFDVGTQSEYVQTLVSKCIDRYIELRVKAGEDGMEEIDPRMEAIVERMFQRCFDENCYRQALGIALEAQRLDKVEEIITRCPQTTAMLDHCFSLCTELPRDFRKTVLNSLVKLHKAEASPDCVSVCKCLLLLEDSASTSEILEKLVQSDTDQTLLAYQIAFNICESEKQAFQIAVHEGLPKATEDAPAAAPAAEGEAAPAPAAEPVKKEAPAGASEEYWDRIAQLRKILAEGFAVDLTLDFLYRNSTTDLLVLQNIKDSVENRNSVLHNATVVAHAYTSGGTSIDTFLRNNLEWLRRATNWAKFTVTAGLGVVNKGHVKQSMALLQPYLPQNGTSTSPYSEAGALYALGLIHVNNGGNDSTTTSYLHDALKNAGTNEIVQHGACLGLGLAAMATSDEELYSDLRNTLFTDSANAGEGAAIAIGMLLLGKGGESDLVQTAMSEMIAYAHDTKHERIIRGIGMGLAFIMYGQQEGADVLIEQLSREKDPILRYGGMYVIAMAFAGTSNNSAVRRLLHVAVSDVNDSVRRAAVTCLGFVLFNQPEQLPNLVALLAESFNPHVRYGACMAVGIGCAGSGMAEAVALLEPMLDDSVDYVRQGAMLAMAMVLQQHSDASNLKVKIFREKLAKIVSDKHQSLMTKMGAILATGIINAGGRNVVISMKSRIGAPKMSAIVGMAVWLQYWYWYPFLHFLSLTFQPTALIGLTKDLKIPTSFMTNCNAKASLFAPPKHLEVKKEEKKERVTTAVLSTTARAKAREARKEAKEKAGEKKDEKAEEKKDEKADAMQVDGEKKDGEDEKKKKAKEPATHQLQNPARLTLSQQAHVTFDLSQRYVPIYQVPTALLELFLLVPPASLSPHDPLSDFLFLFFSFAVGHSCRRNHAQGQYTRRGRRGPKGGEHPFRECRR